VHDCTTAPMNAATNKSSPIRCQNSGGRFAMATTLRTNAVWRLRYCVQW
jgi:hypothetical protein